jgi:hypothetical protein
MRVGNDDDINLFGVEIELGLVLFTGCAPALKNAAVQ